jgi:hypothetical protein
MIFILTPRAKVEWYTHDEDNELMGTVVGVEIPNSPNRCRTVVPLKNGTAKPCMNKDMEVCSTISPPTFDELLDVLRGRKVKVGLNAIAIYCGTRPPLVLQTLGFKQSLFQRNVSS